MKKTINTRVRAGTNQPVEPRLPHEQDESVGTTDGVPSGPVQQAYRDLTRGMQDTDGGPEAGRLYRKLKKTSA